MSAHRVRIAFLLGALALLVTALPGASASASSGEMIVTESKVLTEDHQGWIRVWGEGAVLDCAGYEVAGDGSMHGIYISADDVTIRDCVVSNALSGIVMFGYWEGPVIVGWDGLVLENNRSFANAVNGFALFNGTDVMAVHNKAFQNGEEGFKIRSTTESVFIDNKAHKNGWSGFYITEESTGNVFDSNRATKNEWGFSVDSPIGSNVFTDNVCNRNIFGDSTQPGACS